MKPSVGLAINSKQRNSHVSRKLPVQTTKNPPCHWRPFQAAISATGGDFFHLFCKAYFVENTSQIGQHHTIVTDGNLLLFCLGNAVQNMAAIEHAGPAMDDQVVRGEVFWKVISSDKVEGKPLPYGLSQEPWNLFPSNIFRQRGMGAGLRNENRRALRQMRDGIGPIQEGLDVPLIPCK